MPSDTSLAASLTAAIEFSILWKAPELTIAEIAAHLGKSSRHVMRVRAAYGLAPRRELRRLAPPARDRLHAIEAMAGTMSDRAKALLGVAHERRAIAEDKEARVKAQARLRAWRWRRRARAAQQRLGLWPGPWPPPLTRWKRGLGS